MKRLASLRACWPLVATSSLRSPASRTTKRWTHAGFRVNSSSFTNVSLCSMARMQLALRPGSRNSWWTRCGGKMHFLLMAGPNLLAGRLPCRQLFWSGVGSDSLHGSRSFGRPFKPSFRILNSRTPWTRSTWTAIWTGRGSRLGAHESPSLRIPFVFICFILRL